MCDVEVINHSIVGISKRLYARRIEMESSQEKRERIALSRLNGSISRLYDLFYDEFSSIDEASYRSFGPYLGILIQTLNDLLDSYRQSCYRTVLSAQIEDLAHNLSALTELDSDIRSFRINAPNNSRLQGLLKQLKSE